MVASRVRRVGVTLAVLLVVVAVTVWWRTGGEPQQTARGFVEALRRQDCAAAARYFMATSAGGCAPHLYGLPDDLSRYSLNSTRPAPGADQTAVGVRVPGDRSTAYSLHMVRSGHGWVIDAVDPST